MMNIRNYIDGILFFLTFLWIYYYYHFQEFDPTNHYLEEDSGGEENFMVNIMWFIHCNSSKKDALTHCKDSR